jgi:beta-lactamase regulating signal transducer with metallopeptidase domain
MADIFLKIVNMSISASWIVLAVLLLRLLLKKAPKWITVLLWGIVAIRLICPFSIESVMSLIPSAETISPEIMMENTPAINSGVPIINNIVNPIIGESFASDPSTSANPLQIVVPILSIVWITGIAIMFAYTVISYFRVKSKIGTAVLLRDNIYQSENVVSPFVLGIVNPKIYLPFNMNEQDMDHVIAHENAHIHRKDHWWKPFGYLVLTLHWFNPLMWLGYVLLCRDIEFACDEKVVKEFNNEQKADYSQALLTYSVNRRVIAACPLAFGEVGVKDRVKSVLNYKKPAFWIVVAAIVASIVVAICFLTNPRTTLNDELSVFIDMQVAEHNYSEGHTDGNFVVINHKVLDVDETLNKTTVYMWSMYHEYSCENGKIQLEAGSHIPTVITAKRTGSHRHYELVEYWTPGDGSDYAKDIKAKFPWYLHSKALDSQRYVDEQIAFCENAAKEYFKDADEYVGGPTNIGELKAKYPQFFNISTDGGLTVYIWQMEKNSYYCYLANTSLEAVSDNSFVYEVGATIAEMRAILTTYDIDKKDIIIQSVINPLSSYYYEIDDTYRAKIKELFWKDSYNVIDYDGSSIPKLNVSCGNDSTEASMGTTEWTSDAGNGTMQTINGDSSHPLERIDYLLPLALKVNRSNNATPIVGLNFNVAPDSIKVNSWFLTENGKTKSFDAEVDGFNIKLNAGKETCVYEVVATWNKSAKYYGTVRYSFCVVESNEANAQTSSSHDEWGLKMDILFKSATEFDAVFNHDSSKMTVKGSLTTDPEFEIKAIHNGKVISFGDYMRNVLHYDYADPEFAWDTVLYTIAQNKETSIDQYLLGTYGNLPVGQYLLCKKVTLTTDSGERKTKVYTAEFAITN